MSKTSFPPITNDSLLASANFAPDFNAEIVAGNPAAPVMPFRTTSLLNSAISALAFSPTSISVFVDPSFCFNRSAVFSSVTETFWGLNLLI